MSGPTQTSAKQIVSRDTLDQIFPNASDQLLNLLLRSINADLTSLLRVDASASPNLTVTVGPSVVNNTISGRQQSIPFINNLIPLFTSGSVIFPSTDGGTITVSPGSNVTLNCPSNNYNKILLSLNSSGNIIITQSTPNSSAASVVVPAPVSGALPVCYIILFNNTGTIQPIVQNQIFQFGAGSGGGSSAGYANEVAISIGATSQVVSFPEVSGLNYFPQITFLNLLDSDPQFQPFIVTNRTTTSFTVKWNDPVDSANYILGYQLTMF